MIRTRALIIAFFIGSFSIAGFGQGQLIKRTTTKTDRFDFGSGGTVTITGAPNGSITVVGTNKHEIEIIARIELEAASEADLDKLAQLTGFITDESNVRTAITTVSTSNSFGAKKLPKGFPKQLIGLPFRVDYIVNVPHFTDLEIDGGKGDLSVTGTEGAMKINFMETNAKVEVIGGLAMMTFGIGNIDVAFGTKGWRGRAATVALATGNLSISLPSNMSAQIDAGVLKTGSIDNKLPELKPLDRKIPFTDKSIAAKAGVGGAPLKFTVGDGTLKLMPLVPAH
ncbi:hypothetical protein BH10ACI3_BH10ACI3_04730 [soil metagenome]